MNKMSFGLARDLANKLSNDNGVFSMYQYNRAAEMAIAEIADQMKSVNAEIFDDAQTEHIRAVLSIALKMIS